MTAKPSLAVLVLVFAVPAFLHAGDPPARSQLDNSTSGLTALKAGDKLSSPDGRCHLRMQEDGNLVLAWHETTLWSSKTGGVKNARFVLQSDGNLVIYGEQGGGREQAVWTTYTSAKGSTRFACQSDGNLVLYEKPTDGEEKVVWHTGTVAATPAKFTLVVKRPQSPAVVIGPDIFLRVNGVEVGKVAINTEATFKVAAGRIGRNVVYAYHKNVFGNEGPPFPSLDGKLIDKAEKHAGHRYFNLMKEGDQVNLDLGFSDDADKFKFDVSNEVDRNWTAPEIVKVVYDKEKRVRDSDEPADPPFVIAKGISKTFRYTETATRKVVVRDKSDLEVFIRGKYTGVVGPGVAEIEGGLRARWQKEVETTQEIKIGKEEADVVTGDGVTKYQKIVEEIYTTGTATYYINGSMKEVPFKVIEKTRDKYVVVK